MSTFSPPGRRGRALVAAAVLMLALVAGSAWISAAVNSLPAVTISATSTGLAGGGLREQYSFVNGPTSLSLHVGLVPGYRSVPQDPTLLVFADPTFQPVYGTLNDVTGLGTRVQAYLSLAGSNVQVVGVDANDLYGALEAHRGAALAVLGTGIVPDSVFSNWSLLLPNWVRGGGTLFWGGGPLGFQSGHETSEGFIHSDLDWDGQRVFLGYDLVDPVSANVSPANAGTVPPGLIGSPTPFASALGVTYPGTPEGANTSVVQARGGVVLGWDSPAPGGRAPTTSLAYLPVGNGGLYYFGGGMSAPGQGYIPGGGVDLAQDVAEIVATQYVPTAGPVAWTDLALAPFAHRSLALSVANGSVTGYLTIASSGLDGSSFLLWSQTSGGPTVPVVASSAPSAAAGGLLPVPTRRPA